MPRTKWKRPDIVPHSEGCVPHSISIIRRALGYKTGLPEKWKTNMPVGAEIGEIFMESFPGRHVIALQTNAAGPFGGPFWEDYILAFIYANNSSDESHIVIGMPWTFGEMTLDYVIAVSIERYW